MVVTPRGPSLLLLLLLLLTYYSSSSYYSSYAGGLVGKNSGPIRDSYATGSVSATSTSTVRNIYSYAGGLVGKNSGPIRDSYATGTVSSSSSSSYYSSYYSSYAGGLVGDNSGQIRGSYATGAASSSSSSSSYAGGLVGENKRGGSIVACYATGGATYGLVYSNAGRIFACYATGGGLLFRVNTGTITNSYYNRSNTGGPSRQPYAQEVLQLIGTTDYGDSDELYPASSWNIDIDNLNMDDDLSTDIDDPWDFGTNAQYPVLKLIDVNRDGTLDATDLALQRNKFAPSFFQSSYTFTSSAVVGTVADTVRSVTANAHPLVYEIVEESQPDGTIITSGFSFSLSAVDEVGFMAQVGEIRTTSTSLRSGDRYTLSVKVSQTNGVESTASVVINVVVKPAAPSLTAIPNTTNPTTTIDLSWPEPHNGGSIITAYTLEVSTNGSTFTSISGYDGTSLSYSHTGLSPGTTRHYRVAATNEIGTSPYSDLQSTTTYNIPDAPTNLVATPASGSQIDLSWEAPTNTGGAAITGYQLQFSTDGINFVNLRSTNSTTRSYEHRGRSRGTRYHYQVAAINSVGTGAYSSPVSATTHDLPGVPISLTARPVDDTKIDLAWQAPAYDGGTAVTGYRLQYSTDGINFVNLSSTNSTTRSYEHRGRSRGSTYHYQVAAINSAGTGAYSTPVPATTYDVPGVPISLTARPVDDTKIDLAWQAPAYDGGTAVTGYQISFSTSGGGSFRVDGSTFTYQHTGLESGDTYHYQIAAINSVDRGAYSNSVSATAGGSGGTNTGSGGDNLPTAPVGLTSAAVSDTQISLSWQAPTNSDAATISGYKIQFSAGSSFIDLARVDGSTFTYQHRGLAPGDTYHYRIAAMSSLGIGTYSNTESASTYPAVPRSLTATPMSASQVDLAWQAPANPGGATILAYQLQASTDLGSNFTDLHMTDGTTLSYQHTGLATGGAYHYRVAAINRVGKGAYSNSVPTTVRGSGNGDDDNGSGAGDTDGDNGDDDNGSGDSNMDTLLAVPKVVVDLSLYPNPTLGVVSIEGLSSARRYLYKVYSLVGQEALSGKLGSSAVIDLSELSSGQYILVLKDEKGGSLFRRRLLLLK